jgi:uncharacterized protein (TIGR02284 family)
MFTTPFSNHQPIRSNSIMTTATRTNDEVVSILSDLLENSRDGEYGFRACADEVDDAQIKQVFASRSAQCAEAAAELATLIRSLGGETDTGGTASGALHRGWVHVKGTLGADSALSMLEECERGEDAAVARYRKALKSELPPAVRTLVERQAEGAQRNHDQIRDLRDQYKAKG